MLQPTHHDHRATCRFCATRTFRFVTNAEGNTYCPKHLAEATRNAEPYNARCVEVAGELARLEAYQRTLPGAEAPRVGRREFR